MESFLGTMEHFIPYKDFTTNFENVPPKKTSFLLVKIGYFEAKNYGGEYGTRTRDM